MTSDIQKTCRDGWDTHSEYECVVHNLEGRGSLDLRILHTDSKGTLEPLPGKYQFMYVVRKIERPRK